MKLLIASFLSIAAFTLSAAAPLEPRPTVDPAASNLERAHQRAKVAAWDRAQAQADKIAAEVAAVERADRARQIEAWKVAHGPAPASVPDQPAAAAAATEAYEASLRGPDLTPIGPPPEVETLAWTILAFLIPISIIVYLFPSLVAFRRRVENAGVICLVNVFGGWTIIGWFACMTWALVTASVRPPRVPRTA